MIFFLKQTCHSQTGGRGPRLGKNSHIFPFFGGASTWPTRPTWPCWKRSHKKSKAPPKTSTGQLQLYLWGGEIRECVWWHSTGRQTQCNCHPCSSWSCVIYIYISECTLYNLIYLAIELSFRGNVPWMQSPQNTHHRSRQCGVSSRAAIWKKVLP